MSEQKKSCIVKIPDLSRDRAGTLRLISWWDQDKIEKAKVMVVGAGALGNEVIKNMALMGIGNLFILDVDTIEAANLSRSVLFREVDNGKKKTDTAASAVRTMNSSVKVKTFDGDVNHDLGLGVFRRMDVIIGCLDNREARLSVNRSCRYMNKPWVDGAIEELYGIARVFAPDNGACYECTLSEQDWVLLDQRMPCKDLALKNITLGKVPTTPTISSIIAGIQSQEALKLLHGMNDFSLSGKAIVFNGLTNLIYTTEYPVKEECMSHYTYPDPVELKENKASDTTIKEMLEIIGEHLGAEAIIELGYELVVTLKCPECGREELVLRPTGRVFLEESDCRRCGKLMVPSTTNKITGKEDFSHKTLYEIGVPPLHIIRAVGNERSMSFELTGDAGDVLDFT